MLIQIPSNCPCCSSKLEELNDQLFCRNVECPAQLTKKLEHACKVLSIKGLGPKSLEKLAISDLTELFYLDLQEVTAALGSAKVAEKIFLEIEKAKNASLADVLAAMSIPLVGATVATKLASVISSVDDITAEKCAEAGLGEKVTANLLLWKDTEYPTLFEFLPFLFGKKEKSPVIPTKGIVCITGKLSTYKNKAEATVALQEAGYEVVDSLTKKTTILVDEENKGSSKRKKAEEYGVIIITNLKSFLKD